MWQIIGQVLGAILGSKSRGGAIIGQALNYANSAKNQPQPQANQM